MIVIGRPNVSWYARTAWSPPAFDALYGVRGRYGDDSVNELVAVEREIAVHLARRDVVEPRDADAARRLAQRLGADHVGAEEHARVRDRVRVVRLGREVHDDVDRCVASSSASMSSRSPMSAGTNSSRHVARFSRLPA